MASFTNGVAGVGWPSRAFDPKRRKSGVDCVGLRRKPSRSSKRRRRRSSPGQGARVADAHHLVAQGQHGVEAQGLVAGGVGEQVGVAAVRVADVVVHGAEEGGGHEAARRHRAARVARLGVVEQHRAERAVDEVVTSSDGRRGRPRPGRGRGGPPRPNRLAAVRTLGSSLLRCLGVVPGRRRVAGQKVSRSPERMKSAKPFGSAAACSMRRSASRRSSSPVATESRKKCCPSLPRTPNERRSMVATR